MNQLISLKSIKAIIGLGNPGPKFYNTRHNIGFRVVETLAQQHHGIFKTIDQMDLATITIHDKPITLIMPQTFMNSSGDILPYLTKKGIAADEILVIHDELELPFGKLKLKYGGSAKGHNGLKSIISRIGSDFYRLAIGIDRPENREDVPDYVLSTFKDVQTVEEVINQAIDVIYKNL